MISVKEIDKRISQLEAELAQVEGTQTEVYSRIVGYYRSVNNWNLGKREEFDYRKTFNMPQQDAMSAQTFSDKNKTVNASPTAQTAKTNIKDAVTSEIADGIHSYTYFYRKTCPNCPPVKQYVEQLPFGGEGIDVDHRDGFEIAAKHEVMGAPTVIFFDDEGNEVFRANDKPTLEQHLSAVVH